MAAFFPDDIFKYIVMNENVRISLKTSLNFASEVRINIDSDNGLAPTWRKAIIWTNDG